jgi:hypothetical protein
MPINTFTYSYKECHSLQDLASQAKDCRPEKIPKLSVNDSLIVSADEI